jgi:integrase
MWASAEPESGRPAQKEVPLPVEAWKRDSGSDRRRSGDLSIFSRTLYQLSYRAVQPQLQRRYGHAGESRPYLATLTGLEPATSAVTGRRANQLRYRALLLNSLRNGLVTPTGFEPVLTP